MKFYTTDGKGVLEEVEPRLGTVERISEVVPNTVDAVIEKHVPVIEETADGVVVKVGSVAHPMEPEHYIMWIEVQTKTEVQRKYLNPGDAPEAKFNLPADGLRAYIYCNIHGLWQSE